ncbi:MAG: hypothetical protein ACQEXQ_22040 [Bacillota bacterium]
MKGMTSGGGTSSIKRSFQVAPGETIQKDDVVTVFDNKLYKNVELPVSELPRFSPDVLYLSAGEESRVVHPIGGNGFIHISTTQNQIYIRRLEAGDDGIVEKARKTLTFQSVQVNRYYFKPLTEETGLLCYLDYIPRIWTIQHIRWSGDEELSLGPPFMAELYTTGQIEVETVDAETFHLAWVCSKYVPDRIKIATCKINENGEVWFEGDAFQLAIDANLNDKFVFSKLSSDLFVVSYWLKVNTTTSSIITQLLHFKIDGGLSAGELLTVSTFSGTLLEIRHLVLSPNKYVLVHKPDTLINIFTITVKENKPVAGVLNQTLLTDPFYDLVKITEDRFITAMNFTATGTLLLSLFDTADGNSNMLVNKTILTTVKGSRNKLQIKPLGNDLYAIAFNHVPEANCDYTQVMMLRMAPDQSIIENLNMNEQLINVWDQEAAVEAFCFSALGDGGRFIAAGKGRLKLFRYAWAPMRFITSGIGEFKEATGDNDRTGRSVDMVMLSNGFIAVAYRERDTWHGKLSVFRPVAGTYKPLLSHTFSYSHVDNLSLVEVVPGTIALQYKQRIVPAYDSKQLKRGIGIDEMRMMVAKVSESGLTDKKITGTFYSGEIYVSSRLLKLDNGYLLHIGNTETLTVTARVTKYLGPTGFSSGGQKANLDSERANFESVQLSGNRVIVHTFSKTILLEVAEDGALHVLGTSNLEDWAPYHTTQGFVEDGKGGATHVTTNSNSVFETTSIAALNNRMVQIDDTVVRKKMVYAIKSRFSRFGGKVAFVYRAKWEIPRNASVGFPHQNLFLALLDTEMDSDGDQSLPNDRYYPFPGAADTVPVFVPLDDHHAFCIGTDEFGNQVYMLAYTDGAQLSYGKPYLTPRGIAASDGTSGQHVEVTIRGIAESVEPLQAGNVYYSGRDGRLTSSANARKVGIAVSPNELLIE